MTSTDSIQRPTRLLLTCALVLAAAPAGWCQAVLTPIELQDMRFLAYAGDARSGVGSVSVSFPILFQASRWTPEGGVEVLMPQTSLATAVSRDGRFISGVLDVTGSNDPALFLWSVDSGLQLLPPIAEHNDLDNHNPVGISDDGSQVLTSQGLLWREGEGWAQIPAPCASFTLAEALTPAGHAAIGRCVGSSDDIVRWSNELFDFETLGPGTLGGLSYDGSLVALTSDATSASARPKLWEEEQGLRDLDLLIEGGGGRALAISGGGGVVGGACWGENSSLSRATLWIGETPHDVNDMIPPPGGGLVLRSVVALSEDGLRLFAGESSLGTGSTTWHVDLFPIDKGDDDEDGLLNGWETDGIPYFGTDGQIHSYALDGANPQRKDLYVEVDVMSGVSFGPEEVSLLEDSFFAAAVENPGGGAPGITLHVDVEQDQFDFEATTESEDGWPPFAGTLKEAFFGSVAEQGHVDSDLLLGAKSRAYRYCIAYNKVEITTEDNASIGGLAELGGDDMVLYLDSFDSAINRAATFMHELGHNLGLRHGGGDDINGKPNYPSIMNYTLADRMPWNEGFWKLDYSREELQVLDEAFLDEGFGVGAGSSGQYADFYMPYYSTVAVGSDCYSLSEWDQPRVAYASLDPAATTDFNLDCDHDDLGVLVDLNYLEQGGLPGSEAEPTPGELLFGWNDWANVVLPISPDQGAFAAPTAPDEPTLEQLDILRETFPAAQPFVRYCFGEVCPCGNDDAGAGCANSTGVGASLAASGSASIAADDLVLSMTGSVPNQFGVLYFGGAEGCTPFGDGLRAVEPGPPGRYVRLDVLQASAAGELTQGPGLVSSMSALLGAPVTSGDTWFFQGYYRDPAGPCGNGFNFTNGLAVTFGL